jgi:hypothetical protein
LGCLDQASLSLEDWEARGSPTHRAKRIPRWIQLAPISARRALRPKREEFPLPVALDSLLIGDIMCDIMMSLGRIRRLRSRIEALRGRGGIKAAELESLAQKLGRRRAKRGREPTWVSDAFPDLSPVSIPNHPGDLNRYTAKGILDGLEADLDRHEELLRSPGQEN